MTWDPVLGGATSDIMTERANVNFDIFGDKQKSDDDCGMMTVNVGYMDFSSLTANTCTSEIHSSADMLCYSQSLTAAFYPGYQS